MRTTEPLRTMASSLVSTTSIAILTPCNVFQTSLPPSAFVLLFTRLIWCLVKSCLAFWPMPHHSHSCSNSAHWDLHLILEIMLRVFAPSFLWPVYDTITFPQLIPMYISHFTTSMDNLEISNILLHETGYLIKSNFYKPWVYYNTL